jgi:hypothetical protein
LYLDETYCDAIVVEVCGSIQNLNDKRSRYVPASHSLIATASRQWLRDTFSIQNGGSRPRWQATGTLETEPTHDMRFPVRHLRVLYALPNKLYKIWVDENVPAGYEFLCPHSSLDSFTSPKMQAFLRQMSMASQLYLKA